MKLNIAMVCKYIQVMHAVCLSWEETHSAGYSLKGSSVQQPYLSELENTESPKISKIKL